MQSDKMAYSYRTDNIKHERDCRVLNYEEWMWYALVAQLRFTIFILYPAIRSPIQRNHVECRQWPTMISESVSLRPSFLLSAFLFIPFLLLTSSFNLFSFFFFLSYNNYNTVRRELSTIKRFTIRCSYPYFRFQFLSLAISRSIIR